VTQPGSIESVAFVNSKVLTESGYVARRQNACPFLTLNCNASRYQELALSRGSCPAYCTLCTIHLSLCAQLIYLSSAIGYVVSIEQLENGICEHYCHRYENPLPNSSCTFLHVYSHPHTHISHAMLLHLYTLVQQWLIIMYYLSLLGKTLTAGQILKYVHMYMSNISN